jgi:hypothetical protein
MAAMDVDEVRELMRREIAKFPSQAAWATAIGESRQAVSMMLLNRDPSGKVLKALKIRKRLIYKSEEDGFCT